jgi:hypothetical protein
MVPGVPAGAIAGAVKRAQENVLERLRKGNATHVSRPMTLDGLRGLESRMLARFVDAGVVKKVGEHGYYLEERTLADYEARQSEQARRVLLVMLVIVIVGLAALGLSLLTR